MERQRPTRSETLIQIAAVGLSVGITAGAAINERLRRERAKPSNTPGLTIGEVSNLRRVRDRHPWEVLTQTLSQPAPLGK